MSKIIQPAMGRILLRNLKTEERTAGGLYLPGGKQVMGSVAEVVRVCEPYSSDKGDGPMYAVGDVVVIGKYNGVDIEIERETYIVLQEYEILGRLVEADDAAAS